MKKAIFAIFASLALLATSASAAPLNDYFKVDGNVEVNTAHASAIERVGTGLNVTTAGVDSSGQPIPVVQVFADVSGAGFASFQANAAINGWYRVGTSNKYLSAKNALVISCASGAYSYFTYNTGTQVVNDGCAMANAVKAVSN